MEKIIKNKVWKESKTFRIWSIFNDSKRDITIMAVSVRAKVSRTMVYNVITWMLRNKLIEVTRKVGASRFFRKRIS